MKFLVVGLGSMGKRRIRNLQALGETDIAGFDLRQDRRAEAHARYGIPTWPDFEQALSAFAPQALVISVSPESHLHYARLALALGLHGFIEASVVDVQGIRALDQAAHGKNLVIAPSCTMRYFPGPKKVKEILHSGRLGRVLNLNYHVGQYLPDWHPWEATAFFYVSRRETGGCREIVPFELTWLNDVFGSPRPLACTKAAVGELQLDIDDIYHCILSYPQGVLASLSFEVLSRPVATRELRVLCSEGQLVMSADENCVRHIRAQDEDWTRIPLSRGTPEAGYINPEEPYIAELADFVAAARASNPALFPNTLRQDCAVLHLLEALESIAVSPECILDECRFNNRR